MRKLYTYLLLGSILVSPHFYGCIDLTRQKKSETVCISVTLVNISYDDLGRVLVFTQNSDQEPVIFVKDFYNKSAKKSELKKEMRRYARSLNRLLGELVLVTYYENGIGDRIILKVTRDSF